MSRLFVITLCFVAAVHGFALGPSMATVNIGSSGAPATTTVAAISVINYGATAVDISAWYFCYSGTSTCTPVSCTPTTMLAATTGTTVCNAPTTLSLTSGSLALRMSATGTIASFVQWGAGNQYLVGDAVTAGVWDSATNFVNGVGILTNIGAQTGTVNWISSAAILAGGTVSLSGIFSGATSSQVSSIISGTLVVAGQYSVTGTNTAITVSASATVGGLSVAVGATISMATSGTMRVIGNANIAGTYSVTLGGTNTNIITVTGTATLTGALSVSVGSGFTFNIGQTITIMSYTSLSGGYTSVSFQASTRGLRSGTASGATVACGSTSCAITGTDASGSSSGTSPLTQSQQLIIGLSVGLGVPLVILIIAVICVGCRNSRNSSRPAKTASVAASSAEPASASAAGSSASGPAASESA